MNILKRQGQSIQIHSFISKLEMGDFFHALHEKPFISLPETVFLRSLWELLSQTVSKRHEIH